jgi:hypothetical protein
MSHKGLLGDIKMLYIHFKSSGHGPDSRRPITLSTVVLGVLYMVGASIKALYNNLYKNVTKGL